MSKTQDNLKAAFIGESEARNKYTFFADVARKEGYHYIAKIFEEGGGPHRSDSYGARLSYKSDACQGNHSPSN